MCLNLTNNLAKTPQELALAEEEEEEEDGELMS
jgi:hypothetical protein